MLNETKVGQPVLLGGFTGRSAKLNGVRAYVESTEPDENGCHAVAIEDKPAKKRQHAVVRRMKVQASHVTAIENEKPPKNFHWHFTAKDFRYTILPSGHQPQQID